MDIEIINTPIRFQLHGISSSVAGERYAEVGMGLMNQLWQQVKASNTATTGINHWVYLPQGRMFVGVEPLPCSAVPESLTPLEFELLRYLRHLHIGPYQTLPDKWQDLMAELTRLGETLCAPSLEIYEHQCEDDDSEPETEILLGLKPISSAVGRVS